MASVWFGKSGRSAIEGGAETGGVESRRTAGEGGGDKGAGFVAAAIDILSTECSRTPGIGKLKWSTGVGERNLEWEF
jgi:hypothetical protein